MTQPPEPDRIAVVGAGSVGGWVAARLALGGKTVVALGAKGPVDAIELCEGGSTETAHFSRTEGPADLVIIAVKGPSLGAAAETARRFIGPGTIILPMLNGVPWWFLGEQEPLQSIDPGGRVAGLLPVRQVIGCVVHAACSRPAPGKVVVAHADKLILGAPFGGVGGQVAGVCRLLEAAGIRIEASTDVRRAIWYKLWGNATVNPLCALTRATADRLIADRALRALMLDAMAELAAVGAAIGCPISESGEDRMAVTERLGAFKPSMLQDVEAGRPLEIEALLGAPREIARRHRIATPQLDRIDAMIRLLAEQLGLF